MACRDGIESPPKDTIPATVETLAPSATFISVLGGPGSGKGSLCAWLVDQYRVEHISMGDVMRNEMNRPGSPHAGLIRECMQHGTLGPKEIGMELLSSQIAASIENGTRAFVLDGFPRSLDRLEHFEKLVGPLALAVVMSCSEKTMEERCLRRPGRFDDNVENITKRIRTFTSTTMHVVDRLRCDGRVQDLDAEASLDCIRRQVVPVFEGALERL